MSSVNKNSKSNVKTKKSKVVNTNNVKAKKNTNKKVALIVGTIAIVLIFVGGGILLSSNGEFGGRFNAISNMNMTADDGGFKYKPVNKCPQGCNCNSRGECTSCKAGYTKYNGSCEKDTDKKKCWCRTSEPTSKSDCIESYGKELLSDCLGKHCNGTIIWNNSKPSCQYTFKSFTCKNSDHGIKDICSKKFGSGYVNADGHCSYNDNLEKEVGSVTCRKAK